MSKRAQGVLIGLSGLMALLAACSPAPAPGTPAVTSTLTRTSTPRPTSTRTPTPAPTATPAAPASKDPTTLVYLASHELDTLDPHIDYTLAGSGVLQNIYEGLITFDGADPARFVPLLVESIPAPVSTNDGGVVYTWQVKRDIKFQNGDDLSAEDVAYSFWRAMLLGTSGSSDLPLVSPRTPGFLLLEAVFGFEDAAQLVDTTGQLNGRVEQLRSARGAALRAACQQVKEAVTFDTGARTVTLKLRRAYAPLLATLAGSWAYVMDKNWLTQQGEWNGDCQTWQLFYGRAPEESFIRNQVNGTGPYQLDHWTPGTEIVLTANPNYRSGEAAIKHVAIKFEADFALRLAQLQSGDADLIDPGDPIDRSRLDPLVRDECSPDTGHCTTINSAAGLRVYHDLRPANRADVFFNFAIAPDSPFVGSGRLDGQGVPLNFFEDVHVRRAFTYCFDSGAYLHEALADDGAPSSALTLPDQPGYDGTPGYSFDPGQCADEFKAAAFTTKAGQSLWDTGLVLQLPYNESDLRQQVVADSLAHNLARVSASFVVTPVALSAVDFGRALRNHQLPLAVRSWQEDIHDPHNWYSTYLSYTYAVHFSLPAELRDAYAPLIDQGVTETDSTARANLYSQLNQRLYDDALVILLPYAYRSRYEPAYLKGWFGRRSANLLVADPGYVYELSKR